MAYFKLHAYDADVWIQRFQGLRQIDESLNADPMYATEVQNVETPNGVLQPHAGYDLLTGEFEHPVETLIRFYRRWYSGPNSKNWMVGAENGRLYYRQEGAEDVGWIEIRRPASAGYFQNNVWSWVTYEVNTEGIDYPIDVVLLSNADDGMYMLTPPERPTIWQDYADDYVWGDIYQSSEEYMTWEEVYSEKWNVAFVDTAGKKFGVIERYAERIWGGAIAGEPDMLMYSAPYDPTNWEANTEIPEDGAGSIQQPTWDGDSFTALKDFGDQLIAFKEHHLWRIMGTSPGEYTMVQQFGGGAPYKNTICVDGERIYLADVNGLSVYDGMTVSPYMRDLIEPLWRRINKDAMDQMCAAFYDNRYYLSVPVDDSTKNNALIVLNLHDGTVLYYDDVNAESMLATPEAIYATSSSVPGKVILMHYDSWVAGKATGGATRWVSPWMDFGYKTIQKGGFDLYITPEVQDEAVKLTMSVQTEKKTKTKEYTIYPLNVVNPDADKWQTVVEGTWGAAVRKLWGDISGKIDNPVKKFKQKKLHFGGAGRRFRVIIETAEGVTAPWRLVGGVQMVVETDPD